ncbi:Transcriptional regulator [Streptomyces venezuelae]|nr:Transcriptional regulator [Streptomyces venezuelae]CUM39405.1 hypothetical protein BN2537_7775 [Streptomyces venezuelae]
MDTRTRRGGRRLPAGRRLSTGEAGKLASVTPAGRARRIASHPPSGRPPVGVGVRRERDPGSNSRPMCSECPDSMMEA